jgi:hypothetical protein
LGFIGQIWGYGVVALFLVFFWEVSIFYLLSSIIGPIMKLKTVMGPYYWSNLSGCLFVRGISTPYEDS